LLSNFFNWHQCLFHFSYLLLRLRFHLSRRFRDWLKGLLNELLNFIFWCAFLSPFFTLKMKRFKLCSFFHFILNIICFPIIHCLTGQRDLYNLFDCFLSNFFLGISAWIHCCYSFELNFHLGSLLRVDSINWCLPVVGGSLSRFYHLFWICSIGFINRMVGDVFIIFTWMWIVTHWVLEFRSVFAFQSTH
jgi:hypothetical protein